MPAPHLDDAARLEDVAWMAETGETLSGAARRLGMEAESLAVWLRRRGAFDLCRTLRGREAADEVRRSGALGRWAS
jgi:transposase-like protein